MARAELAREFCLRAYELDRTNKQLYLVWPDVMAALGERDKARVSRPSALDANNARCASPRRRAAPPTSQPCFGDGSATCPPHTLTT